MTLLCLGIVWLLLQGATPPSTISTLGPTGPWLAVDDLTQMGRLAKEAGGELWLVVGEAPEFGRSKNWYATAYLQSDSQSHGVRRGRWILVHAELEDFNAFGKAKVWRARRGPGTYAQVSVDGSRRDQVPDSRDLSRPFPIVAARSLDPPSLSNEWIAEIVSLIRESPAIASPPYPDHPLASISATRVEGTWPIGRLAVIDASRVEVTTLHPEETRGQSVTLRHDGTSWRLESIRMFVQ